MIEFLVGAVVLTAILFVCYTVGMLLEWHLDENTGVFVRILLGFGIIALTLCGLAIAQAIGVAILN